MISAGINVYLQSDSDIFLTTSGEGPDICCFCSYLDFNKIHSATALLRSAAAAAPALTVTQIKGTIYLWLVQTKEMINKGSMKSKVWDQVEIGIFSLHRALLI